MKLSFCKLFLFLFIIINLFQFQTGFPFPSSNHHNDIHRQLYDATNRTLSSLLAPTCYQLLFNDNNIQSEYISSNGLFDRIIPVGTFTTEVLALEYLYAIICPVPNLPPAKFVVQSYNLTYVGYDEKYYITQNQFTLNLTGDIPLTFFANMAFDKDYKLCGYDGQIRNLGLTFDQYTEEEHQANIHTLCEGVQLYCNGTFIQQYASVDACIQFLSTNVPYGSYDNADQGTVTCRLIHIIFAPLLPSVHCPHVGPHWSKCMLQ